jgi:hypothetical protein
MVAWLIGGGADLFPGLLAIERSCALAMRNPKADCGRQTGSHP